MTMSVHVLLLYRVRVVLYVFNFHFPSLLVENLSCFKNERTFN